MVDNVPQVGMGGAAHPRKVRHNVELPKPERGADAVQISADAAKLREAQGVRMDKVMEVKRAIADGTYLTPEKLDRALDKAIDDAIGE